MGEQPLAEDWITSHMMMKECSVCDFKFVPTEKGERRCDHCKPLDFTEPTGRPSRRWRNQVAPSAAQAHDAAEGT